MVGQTIGGKYVITRPLGQGAMGEVYEARHRGTGRRVAIKVITAQAATKPAIVRRFAIEAMALGRIESQHIAQVLDADTDDKLNVPFIVMEFLNGCDLAYLMQEVGRLPVDLVLRIGAQACLGLDRAHQVGVIHRDIKPANIFLSQTDAGDVIVKLLDFGVAKVKMDDMDALDTEGLTRTGMLVGSPLYMSPEQAQGKKTIDARTDIWSLGIVLYQALCGKAPHEGKESIGDLIIAICFQSPEPIRTVAPWVDEATAMLIDTSLALKAQNRFKDASAMLETFRARLPQGFHITSSMLKEGRAS